MSSSIPGTVTRKDSLATLRARMAEEKDHPLLRRLGNNKDFDLVLSDYGIRTVGDLVDKEKLVRKAPLPEVGTVTLRLLYQYLKQLNLSVPLDGVTVTVADGPQPVELGKVAPHTKVDELAAMIKNWSARDASQRVKVSDSDVASMVKMLRGSGCHTVDDVLDIETHRLMSQMRGSAISDPARTAFVRALNAVSEEFSTSYHNDISNVAPPRR